SLARSTKLPTAARGVPKRQRAIPVGGGLEAPAIHQRQGDESRWRRPSSTREAARRKARTPAPATRRRRDFDKAGAVTEPLADADRREQPHHHRRPCELRPAREHEQRCEAGLRPPQRHEPNAASSDRYGLTHTDRG